MVQNISTRTLCLLLVLLSFMNNNTLSNIASSCATYRIITPSTTITIEISMINATLPSIRTNTGTNRCRTAVTTSASTITVVVTIATITMIAINTIMIIITGSLPVLGCYYY